jgi:CRISPR/Cas system CSM-associated protein Csm4 (group 5 of RAMP superfamily)
MEITNDVKRVIVEQKLTLYKNTLYDAELDAKIALLLNDKEDATKARIKQVLKAIELLETELAALKPGISE